ncbi:hypothetical protein ACFVMC_22340 [Nocardia sp. NPDC127579]|uniref:Rv1733c family protein n=1 Tax=Nocardia sp. NPDC127579 TaxID=3345402 RepID=UPI00363B010E
MLNQPRPVTRMWRLRPWNTNPLMRASDRCEILVRIVAVLLVLLAVPVAGAAGTASYDNAATRIAAENATKMAAPAIVVESPAPLPAPLNRSGDSLDLYTAPVRWTWQDRPGTGTVEVPGTAAPGDEVRVWLGPDGNPVPAPLPSSSAATAGIGTALTMLCALWGAALALVCGTAWLLGARRGATWAREWRAIDHRIGGEDRR